MASLSERHGAGTGDTVGHLLPEFAWGHLVLAGKQAQRRLGDACCCLCPLVIAVAGDKIGMQGGRVIDLHHPPAIAQKRMSGLTVFKLVGRRAMPPACHHPCRLFWLGACGFDQHVIHRDRQRAGNQRQCIDPVRIARCRIKCCQHPLRVADECGTGDAQTVEKIDDPVGKRFDAGQRRPARQAMPGEIGGQNGKAAMRKKPALKHPCQMVLTAAMQKDQYPSVRVKGQPAGSNVNGGVMQFVLHEAESCFNLPAPPARLMRSIIRQPLPPP